MERRTTARMVGRPLGLAAAAITLTACAGGAAVPTKGAEPSSPAREPVAAVGCPAPDRSGNRAVSIDYVDFVQAFGRHYVAGLGHGPARGDEAELGRTLLVSRCSFSAVNDRTHADPGEARNGDTAFLPPGTPIRAVRGWSPQCRLGAVADGAVHIYLAYRRQAATATPRTCALRRRSGS